MEDGSWWLAFGGVQNLVVRLLDYQLNGQGNRCLETNPRSARGNGSHEKWLLRTGQENQAEEALESQG